MAGNYNLGTAEGTIRINYDGTGSKQAQVDLGRVDESGRKAGASLQDVGQKSLIAGGILAAGLGYAAKKAIDFEKQVSAIGAVSGASTQQLEQLRKKALQIGADTSFSASEAANAMEELVKAGISVQDVLNGAADAAVALAAAGGVDVPTAAAIAANSMNLFGLSAAQLPKVVDQIAGAANSSAIDVKEFGFSLAQVGAVAKLAGLSFEDTAVAITAMGKAGIKGSDAGTSLKSFLSNLIPTTKTQIALSEELGLLTKDGSNAFFDQTGKVKSLAEVSGVLQNALKGMTKEQQLMTLNTLFGSDAIRAAAVLADQGSVGFKNLSDEINKISAADVAAARLDNVAGKLEQLKGASETAAIQLGSILLPSITKLVKGITSLVSWFSNLSSGTQKTIVAVVGIVAAVLLVGGAIIKIIAIVNAFKVAWIALNISFIATPIGAIITAVIALIVIIVLIATKTTWFQQIWEKIWGFMKVVGAWFAGPFAGFFVDMWNKIFPVLKAIGDFFVDLWNQVVATVQFAWSIISAVMNFFAPLFQAVFSTIAAIVSTVWAVITALFQVGFTIWSAIFGAIAAVATTAFMGLWNSLVVIGNAIRAVWDFLWNAMQATIRLVWGAIGPYVMFAVNIIRDVITSTLGVIQTAWNFIWNAIWGTIMTVWNAITSIVAFSITTIVNYFAKIREGLDKVRNFFNQLKEAASGGVGSLLAFVAGIPGRIWNALGNTGSMLYNAGRNIIQGLVDGIRNMAGRVYDAVQNVLSNARNLLPFSPAKEGPFSGRGWTLYSGQSLADAMATGITDHADKAVQATLKMVSEVSTAAQASSPLMNQFNLGGSGNVLAPAPRIDIQPRVTVIADLGDGVRSVTKSTIVENPDLVANANAQGSQKRNWAAPGRAS